MKNQIGDSMVQDIIIDLTPKIKKVLMETSFENRDDLEQELKLFIIEKLKKSHFQDVPGFFEFLDKNK